MPKFYFEAMDATGIEIKDQIEAEDEREARDLIRQMGYFVTMITPEPTDHSPYTADYDMPAVVYLPLLPQIVIGIAILIFGFLFGLIVGMNFQS